MESEVLQILHSGICQKNGIAWSVDAEWCIPVAIQRAALPPILERITHIHLNWPVVFLKADGAESHLVVIEVDLEIFAMIQDDLDWLNVGLQDCMSVEYAKYLIWAVPGARSIAKTGVPKCPSDDQRTLWRVRPESGEDRQNMVCVLGFFVYIRGDQRHIPSAAHAVHSRHIAPISGTPGKFGTQSTTRVPNIVRSSARWHMVRQWPGPNETSSQRQNTGSQAGLSIMLGFKHKSGSAMSSRSVGVLGRFTGPWLVDHAGRVDIIPRFPLFRTSCRHLIDLRGDRLGRGGKRMRDGRKHRNRIEGIRICKRCSMERTKGIKKKQVEINEIPEVRGLAGGRWNPNTIGSNKVYWPPGPYMLGAAIY
ncbi:hypothetical protein FB451DRAFT_1185523 [Mycena latifolia]|nr:hypothetical protein FB451DRAFT_1185523 [Mycena latifolia]